MCAISKYTMIKLRANVLRFVLDVAVFELSGCWFYSEVLRNKTTLSEL